MTPEVVQTLLARLANEHFEEKKDFDFLQEDEVVYVTLKNGRKVVFAKYNVLGGLCDDCSDEDLFHEEVVDYEIVSVSELVYGRNCQIEDEAGEDW